MTIYFVRHGESVNNVSKNYQGADVKLSDLGCKQAEIVAERLTHVPIDVILASSFTRAHDT
jgi:broad specificity phosphatase PhoE